MKAMIINSFGGPEIFEPAELPKPELKPGNVLVCVEATSVNTVDTVIREVGEGLPFSPALPAVLGMDFAGTVEAIASDVTDFAIGDEVYGCAGGLGNLQGALAEYMLADVNLIARKPANLTMREAAALPLVGITAYEGLLRAGTKSGQQVLVHGGGGGVGHVAVQLARYFGAEVFATVGRESHQSLVEEFGAKAINYKTETVADYVDKYTNGAGFDVVFDSVGGPNIATSFEAAKLNGQVATTGSLLEMDLSLAHMKGLSLHVVFMLIQMIHNVKRKDHARILSELTKIVEAGHLRPVLDEMHFSMTDIGNAHARLSSGKATGKIVVSI